MSEEAPTGEDKAKELFMSTAIRGPKDRTSEELLCMKLYAANRTSDPLQRVRFICEAAWFSKDRTKSPGIDFSTVDWLYQVAVALTSVEKDQVVTSYWQGRPYQWIWRYPIPWPFQPTRENFARYIMPWYRELPKCWGQYVTPLNSFRVYKTKVSCSGCGELFLDLTRTSNEQCKDLVKEKFRDKIKVKTLPGISKKTYKAYQHSKYEDEEDEWESESEDYLFFKMPYIQVGFFECPKCGKPVVLATRRLEGDYPSCDPEIVKNLEDRLEAKATRLNIEDYDYLKEEWLHRIFFEASEWPTREGYKEIRNQFIAYADPVITELEAKLAGMVSPQTFAEFFKKTREEEGKGEPRKEEEREGEEGQP